MIRSLLESHSSLVCLNRLLDNFYRNLSMTFWSFCSRTGGHAHTHAHIEDHSNINFAEAEVKEKREKHVLQNTNIVEITMHGEGGIRFREILDHRHHHHHHHYPYGCLICDVRKIIAADVAVVTGNLWSAEENFSANERT